jgi:hypothetical protein
MPKNDRLTLLINLLVLLVYGAGLISLAQLTNSECFLRGASLAVLASGVSAIGLLGLWQLKDRLTLERSAIATYKAMYGEDAEAEFLPVLTLDEHREFRHRLINGDCSAQDVIDIWHRFYQSIDALQIELSKLTKAELAKKYARGFLRPDTKKYVLVNSVLENMRNQFHPHWYGKGSMTYAMGDDLPTLIHNHIHE